MGTSATVMPLASSLFFSLGVIGAETGAGTSLTVSTAVSDFSDKSRLGSALMVLSFPLPCFP